ncbi:hypothetical protein N9W34_03815 [Rickettsiales bacterium]|nr:hypothetical protein [Rickettsiales bacterium]
MKPLFNVSVLSLKKIYDLPGTWSEVDFRKLLEQLEVDGIEELSGSDLSDMAIMALQDMEPDDAADAVLAYQLQSCISAGARQNLVQDLLEDQRPWEEAADITVHSRIFAAASLLQKALPKTFTKPDIMKLVLNVTALTPEAKEVLLKAPEPAFITRMLADGMSESCILERLFDEQLFSHSFPEASGIIWQAEFSDITSEVPPSANLTIYSSKHWLKAMESVSDFQSKAYNDIPKEKRTNG